MDLKQILLGIQVELVTLGARMKACENTAQTLTTKAQEFTAKCEEFTADIRGASEHVGLLAARFNEGIEMLVQNHTDALQKQQAMQQELDEVKERLEKLEKRFPPTA